MNLFVTAGLMILFVAVLISLASYRLWKHPFDLERFRSQFEQSLSDKVTPLHATIEDLVLARVVWSGFEIVGKNVRLTSADGHTWVSFAQITLRRPLSALLSKISLVGDGADTAPWPFSGTTVDALKPQVPFEHLHGIATLTDDSLRFDIAGGSLAEIAITKGTVTLKGLGTSGVSANISFDCRADACDGLQVISNSPLNLVDLSAVNLNELEGTVEADVDLAFAFDDLPHIEYRTNAEFHIVRLSQGPTGLNLTAGRFEVTATNDDMVVEGGAHLCGVPTKIAYRKPAETGSETLRIDTADIGAIVSSLNISGRLIGGSLQGALSRAPLDQYWSGPIEIHNVRILQAPLLARLLTMASFPGLLSTLTTSGLTVDRAYAEATIEGNIIGCTTVRISVDQLEITGNVAFNLKTGLIEGEGLLIPAASLQRLVGSVPFLGAVLEGLGKKNTPIVATRFTLSGPLSYPEITIDPLAGLAPEILREFGIS